ncbi:MAG TPA: beta-galactosidase [Bryobacteraceae bacterium]|nr:beta-galactosidase [Bryobacteraceae bacterium]
MKSTKATLWLLPLLSAGAWAAAPGFQWNASAPQAAVGLHLANGPHSHWRMESIGGAMSAHLFPVKDYYSRACFLVQLDQPATGQFWLQVRYVDRGYGLISVSYGKEGGYTVPQPSEWGVARLNTDKIREADFRIDSSRFQPDSPPILRIEGLRMLVSLAITAAQPARAPIPDVAPAVQFRVPGQRVMSAGADARSPDGLNDALASLRNILPLVRALGFNGVESYVKWGFVERSPGVFDWSYYDAVVAEVQKHGLKWFPLLIVGSAYALPDWFYHSSEHTGYECLEHHIGNDIPTIFNHNQDRHVQRFLAEFGKHYANRGILLGVRLGPSGNYGEAQYPAAGNWGYHGKPLHTHLGYWAADPSAVLAFRAAIKTEYADIAALNHAWTSNYKSFDEVTTFLPESALNPRMRFDFTKWYMDSMSRWCARWAEWARASIPNTPIYQSSGGWGAVSIGTDYTAQARAMGQMKEGIRLTNETDMYPLNFTNTRMAASAARFYGAKLGFEPASLGTLRGVMARLFNAVTNGADHLFYYYGHLLDHDGTTEAWIQNAPVLDQRALPVIDIAAFYPDTSILLHDEPLRYLSASAWIPRAEALRKITDYDYASEQMILDGALSRYRALVFLWGIETQKPVLDKLDAWVRSGGIIIYPLRQQMRQGLLGTVDGDRSVINKWRRGDTGTGHVIFYDGHPEIEYYMQFLRDELPKLPLNPLIHQALEMQRPSSVYWSVLANGKLALLNFDDSPARVHLSDGRIVYLKPYEVTLIGRNSTVSKPGT